MNALQVLAQRNPKEAGKAVVNALADRDEEVRRTALVAALTYSIEVPTDTLVGLAYSDVSATIRHDALAALQGWLRTINQTRTSISHRLPNGPLMIRMPTYRPWLSKF